jgi:hypothetical protein
MMIGENDDENNDDTVPSTVIERTEERRPQNDFLEIPNSF